MVGKIKADARASLARFPWDVGPLTRNQLSGKVVDVVIPLDPKTGKRVHAEKVVRTRREAWIDRYHRKGKLTVQQFNIAAELFEASQGFPSRDVLAALRIDRPMGDHDPLAAAVDRRRKFFAMAGSVPPYARAIIAHVVLQDQSVRSIAGCLKGQQEARHLDRLQRGLDALHDLWGRKSLTGPK